MSKKLFKNETGIDDDGNKNYTYTDKVPTWISPTKLQMPNGKIVTFDPNEVSCEIYNPSKHKLIFENTHYDDMERFTRPVLICEPDGFLFLPHKYFKSYVGYKGNKSDTVECVVNQGDNMFIGNKKVSRPEYTMQDKANIRAEKKRKK